MGGVGKCRMRASALCLLLLVSAASAAPTRVLFVGNSFTFVNDLPKQLENIGKSLGRQIVTNTSTIGGCTIYAQTAEHDNKTAALLDQDWDFIVLQSYSDLTTVQQARENYLHAGIGSFIRKKKSAKVVLYLTWGYHDGGARCPTGAGDCFPLGTEADLTQPSCKHSSHYNQMVTNYAHDHRLGNFSCMGYAVARGYLDAMAVTGADLVVPCGLAWQVVRGVEQIPQDCRRLIDAQYNSPLAVQLPLRVDGGSLPNLPLYRLLRHGEIDKHPSVAGQYLNALTFYSTLFNTSAVGAAPPLYESQYKQKQDRPLSAAQLKALQTAASGVSDKCGRVCRKM